MVMDLDIGLGSLQVERVAAEFTLLVVFDGGVELRIETVCMLTSPTGETLTVDPEHIADNRDVASLLVGQTVQSAGSAPHDGLTVMFQSGGAIRVPPHYEFEAWTLSRPDGSLVVALPGGGISQWSPPS